MLMTFNPKDILISQPVHMDTGKSSFYRQQQSQSWNIIWCTSMKVSEKLARVQMPICHIPCKYTLIVFILKCPEPAIINVNVTLPGDFQKQESSLRQVVSYCQLPMSLQNHKRARTSRRTNQSHLARVFWN